MTTQALLDSLHLYHYYDRHRGPFRNLSDLPPTEAEAVLANIRQAGQTFAADCCSWEEFSAYPTEELGIIINISGAGVSDQSWSTAYKQVMTDSRLHTTNICVELCKQNPEIRLINASAVSAYGFYDDAHMGDKLKLHHSPERRNAISAAYLYEPFWKLWGKLSLFRLNSTPCGLLLAAPHTSKSESPRMVG